MRHWLLLACVGLAASAFAQDVDLPTGEQVANAKYVGARSCRACHNSVKQGRMYAMWQESKHSKAYELLATPEAMEVAQREGVENPQTHAKCLSCHVTAHNVPAERKHRRFSQEEGVGCESCHGPGEFYRKKAIMCLLTVGRIEPDAVGLVNPTEAVCVTCHNANSPTHAGEFNFEESVQQIAHPLPPERRQKVEEEGCVRGSGGK